MSHWIENLNPEQQQAVLHDFGPLLILAGAGSGKTTVLVSRTGRLIDERIADPKRICVLTFTNKAAHELKSRVASKIGNAASGVWAGTFHSFGLQVLRQFHKEAGLPQRFGILDSGDAQSVVKELMSDFTMAEKSDFDAGKLISMIGQWREKGQSQAQNGEDPYEIATQWLLPKYLRRLQHLGVVDFDSLLLKPLKLFEKHPEIELRVQSAFTQVMVDEFQDTNRTQMQLVRKLAERHQNITVVGDDDQSIYGWRGACIENILQFPKTYDNCSVIRLERNYRSTPTILNLANSIISKNEKRHGKVLRPSNQDSGELPELFVYESEDEEVTKTVDDIEAHLKEGHQPSDIAILFRSNGQGALFEAELKQRQIPHQVASGSGFFERKEIKDILAYLRCAIRPNEVALRRILNTPPRGLGEAAVDHLSTYAEKHRKTFYESLSNYQLAGLAPQACEGAATLLITLTDLHEVVLNTGTQAGVTTPSHPSASVRLQQFFNQIGYKHHIEKHSKDGAQASARWRLIEIFGNVLDKFFAQGGCNSKTLREFIDAMELHDPGDSEQEKKSAVQLLTMHACKGLEFPVVYIAGLEEDILPHRTLGSDVTEERRLFYVAVTRARRKLIMSRARQRKRYGKLAPAVPSRFLLEIPAGLVKEYELGWRPINSSERQSMLAELYKKIEAMESQK